MHTTNQLLDAVATKHGNATDYRLSKLLNTSTSSITSYRKGRSRLSVEFAHRVAALLDWEPAYVVACVEHERAVRSDPLEETGEVQATWEKIAERFRPVVPGIVLAACAMLFGGISEPAQAGALHSSTDSRFTTVYIMRTRRNARRARGLRELLLSWRTWFPVLEPGQLPQITFS